MDVIVDGSLDDTNRDLKSIHQEFVGVKSAPEILPVNGQFIKVWGVMLKTPGFDID